MKKEVRKILFAALAVPVIVVVYLTYVFFAPNIFPNKETETFVCIPENTSFEDVVKLIKNESRVWDSYSLRLTAKIFDYDKNIRSGRYALKKGMNNFALIRNLRSGRQVPLRLTFNNIRTKEQLAGRLSSQLMTDSLTFLKLLNNSQFLSQYGLNPDNSIVIFIPNTYEVFWNIKPEKLFNRMYREYLKFWNEERKQKAASIPLTPIEVSILASIVEEESNKSYEQPIIAGVYINRLKNKMPLQADPTIKFAWKDFSLKRIRGQHLQINSPFNTYKFQGLPPGPIRLPSPQVIDAVLNYSHHSYLYMCAKETLNGEHNFATTHAEHLINARKYQRALNERQIFE